MCEADRLLMQEKPHGRFVDRTLAWLAAKRPAAYALAAEERHEIRVRGEVTIQHGDVLQTAQNRIVNQGARTLANLIYRAWVGGVNVSTSSGGRFGNTKEGYVQLGTSATTTTCTLTTLQAPIATLPNTSTYTVANPSAGVYRARVTSLWNAGALTEDTVRELGLFCPIANNVDDGSLSDAQWGTVARLAARLTSGDADFTAFTINPAIPLTVEWRWNFIC